MDTYLTALKDILVIIAPIIIAYISYRSNKKTRTDIKYEVERMTKEKEAETKQILDKIGAELESQKQLISWQNSMPQTNEYTSLIEVKRFGNVSALPKLCQDIRDSLCRNPSMQSLIELNTMLNCIELPNDGEELYPHEVPIILNYKIVRHELELYITRMSSGQIEQEEPHANT